MAAEESRPIVASMRTPAGFDCKFFYADYHRGRNIQACRLLDNQAGPKWEPALCATCRVPQILRANACPNLTLEAKVHKSWGGLKRRIVINAFCTKTLAEVVVPEIGCGHCHETINILKSAEQTE